MNDSINKPWLKNYPQGVSSNINFDEYSSLVDMFNKTCDRFNSKNASDGPLRINIFKNGRRGSWKIAY